MMDNIIFLQDWFNELKEDEFSPLSNEEVSYILYAAAIYSWTGERTNFEETFDRRDLNRVMAPYYAQIDKIKDYRAASGKNNIASGNQSYDSEKVKELAAQGVSQKKICQMLGYDETRSRSLSSNKGYKEGREIFLKQKSKKLSELTNF